MKSLTSFEDFPELMTNFTIKERYAGVGNHYSGYLITRASLYPSSMAIKLHNLVLGLPFEGPKTKKILYYKQIKLFILHLSHIMLHSEETGIKDTYVPIYYKLGIEKLNLVFDPRLKYRALDHLLNLGIVESTTHTYTKGHSREFKVSDEVMRDIFGAISNKKEIVQGDIYTRILCPLTAGPKSIRTYHTVQYWVERSHAKGLKKPIHDLKSIGRDKQVRYNYEKALDLMRPHKINFKNLLSLIEELEQQQNKAKSWKVVYHLNSLYNFLTTLVDNGLNIVERDNRGYPTIIEYYPIYKVAAVGGRLFESNGFQGLAKQYKWKLSLGKGNYDMVACQSTILKSLLKENSIESDFQFTRLDVVARELSVSKDDIKLLLYGTLFNAGKLNNGKYSKVFLSLAKLHGETEARNIVNSWNQHTKNLIHPIEQLCVVIANSYSSVNQHGYTFQNLVGTKIQTTKITAKFKRQLLAHIIQGIESFALLKTINDESSVVYALEHDGFVGYTKLTNLGVKGLRYEVKHIL